MSRPWKRPDGCDCSESFSRRERCTKNWIRCNARLNHLRSIGEWPPEGMQMSAAKLHESGECVERSSDEP